jgi:viroplasmin and RNaseH domain-containing protein
MAPRRPSYYACPISRAPGIYTAWEDAKRVVDAYPGAIHKVRKRSDGWRCRCR